MLEDIAAGHSCVIGLQSTGETCTSAYLDEEIADLRVERDLPATDTSIQYEDVPLPAMISTVSATARSFLRNHFPVKPHVEEGDIPPKPDFPVGGSEHQVMLYLQAEREREALVAQSNEEPDKRLIDARQMLAEQVGEMELPPNPLDSLIDSLGGESMVAEMTGRSGRVVRVGKGGKGIGFRYKARGGGSAKASKGLSSVGEVELDVLNVEERRRFQEGEKFVAVISDAASTGISLHASGKCASGVRRRVHYTIEQPWAADKAIQQLGRSHRSGQLSAPIYRTVVTNLGGERRFAAAVAKRMANLGALTKGDRRAASGGDLGEFNVDSKHGNVALQRVYACLVKESDVFPSKGTGEVLDGFVEQYGESAGLVKNPNLSDSENQAFFRLSCLRKLSEYLRLVGLGEETDIRKKADVKVFLNRIMSLPVGPQNLLFALFDSTLKDVIMTAKESGWYVVKLYMRHRR